MSKLVCIALSCLSVCVLPCLTLTNVHPTIIDAAPDVFLGINTLDTSYKNPCFRSPRHPDRLRCLPYFNLLGVAKAGTSDLYAKLVALPQVVGAGKKEPFYWSERRMPFDEYLDNFNPCAKAVQENRNAVTGEASTETFHAAIAPIWMDPLSPAESLLPRVFKAAMPLVRPLVILRDPAERLYSAFWFFGCSSYFVWAQDRIKSFDGSIGAQSFHKYILDSLGPMQDCLDRQETVRNCIRLLYNSNAYHLVNGIYVEAAREWLKVYQHPEEIKFINFDASRHNETAMMLDIVSFLDLDPPSASDIDRVGRVTANHGHQLNPRIMGCSRQKEPMLPETRELLQEFYRPYNLELAELLGDDTFQWDLT